MEDANNNGSLNSERDLGVPCGTRFSDQPTYLGLAIGWNSRKSQDIFCQHSIAGRDERQLAHEPRCFWRENSNHVEMFGHVYLLLHIFDKTISVSSVFVMSCGQGKSLNFYDWRAAWMHSRPAVGLEYWSLLCILCALGWVGRVHWRPWDSRWPWRNSANIN